MILALVLSTALADCPETPTRTTLELTTSLESAENAYRNADVDGFLAAAGEMDAVVPCVGEIIPRSMVARLHRTFGIRAFVGRNSDRAADAFSGARAIEPTYTFPPEMVPAQHPMAKLYLETDDTSTTEPVEKPAVGYLTFDGRRSLDRPYSRVTLMQRIDEGQVLGTWYLWPADKMPDYEVWNPEAPPRKGLGLSKTLLIGAGAAAVIAGGTYAAAGVNRSAYNGADVEHKDALRSRTNALVFTSAGVGVAAAGLGATAVVVGQW